MIKATCPACSLNYAVARGHQCPNGADQPPVPWKDRKLAYHRLYSKAYMPGWRERRRRFEMKAEELRTVADGMKSPEARATMNRLADSYEALANSPILNANPFKKEA